MHAVLESVKIQRWLLKEFMHPHHASISSGQCGLTTSSSSTSTMSYALRAPQKMMQVTPSKQWIHFFLSDLWPPTSNILVSTEKIRTNPVGADTPKDHAGVRWDSPEVQLFAGELFFDDTSCFDSRSQHILLGWEVFRFADSVHFVEVADGWQEKRNSGIRHSLCLYTLRPQNSTCIPTASCIPKAKRGLTSQQSRSAGTQQLFRRRPARQSLSTAS